MYSFDCIIVKHIDLNKSCKPLSPSPSQDDRPCDGQPACDKLSKNGSRPKTARLAAIFHNDLPGEQSAAALSVLRSTAGPARSVLANSMAMK